MNISCFKANCPRIVAFECYCKLDCVYSCTIHIGEHQLLKGKHKLQPLLVELENHEFEKLNLLLSNANKYLNEPNFY